MRAQPACISFADVLRSLNWLDGDMACALPADDQLNLLPLILEHCSPAIPPRERDWLDWSSADGAQLRIWPVHRSSAASAYSAASALRLAWCPAGLPSARRVGVLSSHLGRRPDELREWFELLRTIVDSEPPDVHFVTAGKTTTRPWLEQLLARSGHALVLIQAATAAAQRGGVGAWLQSLARQRVKEYNSQLVPVFLSPPLADTAADAGLISQLFSDQAILDLADDIYVLRLTSNGRLRQLLHQELRRPRGKPLQLAVGPRLVPADTALDLCDRGCQVWRTAEAGPRRKLCIRRALPAAVQPPPAGLLAPGMMLTHWTRPTAAPWPDEQPQQFRDCLLFDRPGADRSALGVLMRIARMKRLCASSQSIRQGFEVVCFTAVPWAEMLDKSVYRAHRGRWDFCSYGICISQQWLRERGARPVIYGDEDVWNALSQQQRPYFQAAETQPRRNTQPVVNWRDEREWRVSGDVDLSGLSPDQAFLFVPSADEARWLSFVSRWPVYVTSLTAPEPSRLPESVQ